MAAEGKRERRGELGVGATGKKGKQGIPSGIKKKKKRKGATEPKRTGCG